MAAAECAVIVVDMLNDFVRGSLAFETSLKIIGPSAEFLAAARRRGWPVIYACDAHRPGLDRELELWPEHALAGTYGAQVIDELKAQPGDLMVAKRRYSGFWQTDLDMLLRELGARKLLIMGIYLPLCVRHTVGDAYNLGYDLVVVSDCVASVKDEDYEADIKYLRDFYGVKISSAAEILAAA